MESGQAPDAEEALRKDQKKSRVRAMTRRSKIGIVVGVSAAAVVGVALLPRTAQNLAYHRFADVRTMWDVANALNVLSNVPFVVVGLMGLAAVLRGWGRADEHFIEVRDRWPYAIFFAGVTLTCFGSSYYHLAPDNARLVWDRLPMTLGFMSLFAAMIGERISLRAGMALLGPLNLAGLASVVYWWWTESHGAGDLRPYIAVQFFPLLAIPLMLVMFAGRYTRTVDIWVAVGWYGAAKVLELLDGQIYRGAGGVVSGHSLKHVAAAAAAWWVLRMLERRKGVTRRQ